MACGSPFPWLDRQGLLYLLGNRLQNDELGPAEKLAIREQLDALADLELGEEEQVRRWRRIAEAAPEVWKESGVREIVVQVATQSVRALLKWE